MYDISEKATNSGIGFVFKDTFTVIYMKLIIMDIMVLKMANNYALLRIVLNS